MAWIESHQNLRYHPKTFNLSRLLGIGRATAVGHLHFLWHWSLDFAEDGNLGKYSPEVLAEAAGWETGDVNDFISALVESGFIDRDEKGNLFLHDWMDFAGKLIERRRADRERKRLERESNEKRRQ